MIEFGLPNNKNGKKTTFLLRNICLLNTNNLSIEILFKTFNNYFKIDYE